MKFRLSSLLYSALAAALAMPMASTLTSCGEDRSGEYYSLIQEDRWIYTQMEDLYLWYEDMPTKSEKDFFADPEEFFESLLSTKCRDGKGDTFSVFEAGDEDEATEGTLFLDETSTYGFDFLLYNDPTGTTAHLMARVVFVLPDSPAAQAGLKRGDWILQVGENTITSNNYGYLISGGATTLTTAPIVATETTSDDGTSSYVYDWGTRVELSIGASKAMQSDPFYKKEILSVNGRKVGYLMYDSFTPGITDDSDEYTTEMKEIFTDFRNKGVEDFVLDLRYNLGGYVTSAVDLMSCLAPSDRLGSNLLHLVYNDKNQDRNYTYTLEKDWESSNLNLSRLFVITTSYTASASEAVINCLRPYMNVYTLGETTLGKNVASIGLVSPYNFTIRPIVATVYNSANESDYSNGIPADFSYSELNNIAPLGELGDPNSDALLYYALRWIALGDPTAGTDEAIQSAVMKSVVPAKTIRPSKIYNSLEHKRVRGNRL